MGIAKKALNGLERLSHIMLESAEAAKKDHRRSIKTAFPTSQSVVIEPVEENTIIEGEEEIHE